MKVYHGSYMEIQNPNLHQGRVDIDFGQGFYLTEDRKMAEKWAAGKSTSVLNVYELDFQNLNVVKLGLTEQWLDFVSYNRGFGDKAFDTESIDVIIGPTADDKMFNTLSLCFSGLIDKKQTIKYLNVAGYSNQIVLKTDKAIKNLSFLTSKEIKGLQKKELIDQIHFERKHVNKLLKDMMANDKQKHQEREVLSSDYEQER